MAQLLPLGRKHSRAYRADSNGSAPKTTHNILVGGKEMKVIERFLAMNLCILMLSLLFVFSEKMGAAEISDTETTDVYQERVFGAEHGDSGAWADEGEEEYKESPNEDQYSEEAEEEGMEYESAPSDLEHESAPQWPSDEEEVHPPTPYSDDDMAQGSIEE
jgi:hypothetical protein